MFEIVKKVLIIILAASMIFGLIACRAATDPNDNGDEIVLTWIMAGPGEQRDATMVWEEFNRRLQSYEGMENVRIEFIVVSDDEYRQRFPLMLAGGRSIDIVSTWPLDFAPKVRAGHFLPLDDLIANYAPAIKDEVPDWVRQLMTINDTLYAVPNYQLMPGLNQALVMRREQADRFFDQERAKEVFHSNPHLTQDCLDIIDEYLRALRNAGDLRMGINPTSTFAARGFHSIGAWPYLIRWVDERAIVVNFWETPEIKLAFSQFRAWFEEGFIRQDIFSISHDDTARHNGTPDGFDVWTTQSHCFTQEFLSKQIGMDILVTQFQAHYYIPNLSLAGGVAIMAGTEHPKHAIRLIELMHTEKGRDLYNLLVFGIENVHFTRMEDGRIETEHVGQGTATTNYGLWPWIVGNTKWAFETTWEEPGFKDYVFNDLNVNAIPSPFAGFTFDTSSFESNLLQIRVISGEFDRPLSTGSQANHEALYREFMERMEIAGNSYIIENLQRQADAFLGQ